MARATLRRPTTIVNAPLKNIYTSPMIRDEVFTLLIKFSYIVTSSIKVLQQMVYHSDLYSDQHCHQQRKHCPLASRPNGRCMQKGNPFNQATCAVASILAFIHDEMKAGTRSQKNERNKFGNSGSSKIKGDSGLTT